MAYASLVTTLISEADSVSSLSSMLAYMGSVSVLLFVLLEIIVKIINGMRRISVHSNARAIAMPMIDPGK